MSNISLVTTSWLDQTLKAHLAATEHAPPGRLGNGIVLILKEIDYGQYHSWLVDCVPGLHKLVGTAASVSFVQRDKAKAF